MAPPDTDFDRSVPMSRREPKSGRRIARMLLAVYCAFLLYGSFFPFRFSSSPDVFHRDLEKAVVSLHDSSGKRRAPISDFASNVLLGVAFGALLVWGGLAGTSLAARLARVGLLDLVLSSAIEAGQLFIPARTASVFDVVAQVMGSLVGVLAAHAWLRTRRAAVRPCLLPLLQREPAVAALGILIAVLAADAFYPYAATLDVSTAWGNLKRGQWVLLESLDRRFWGDLLVEKVLAFGALAALLRRAMVTLAVPGGRPGAWAASSAFAALLETGKLGVVGRFPSVDNVLLAGAGAFVGVTVVPALISFQIIRDNPARTLVWTAAWVLTYEELSPFDFTFSALKIQANLSRIEWLPFAAYYDANPQSALFDLGKKLILGGFLGAALCAAYGRRRVVWAVAVAALLEATQIFQLSYVPSVTDVLTLGAGAAAGAALLNSYRSQRVRLRPR